MSSPSSLSSAKPHRSSAVICIGTGASGIALGALLKRTYNLTDVHFYERNSGAGGTWFSNTYPGAACDVPSGLYSFSFAQSGEWTASHPEAAEIRKYMDGVAADYDIPAKTTFRTEVVAAHWNEATERWLVHLKHVESGEEYSHECKILFSAVGLLVDPIIPTIPGQEKFEGAAFHTARWDHSVSLEGKNVAIIGNGCSATQVIPSIAPKVASVNQFIRTKHWIQKAITIEFTKKKRELFKRSPFIRRFYRLIIFLAAEWDFRLQGMSGFSIRQRAQKMKNVENFIRSMAPAKYHDLLIPDFQIACKRRINDPTPSYLGSLNFPNVALTDEKIVEITPNSIRTSTNEYPTDVLVYATGFDTNHYLGSVEVRGRGGVSIKKHWEDLGGAGAYKCTAMHGFPNFFMILGPNTATGHTSCIMASENTIGYALKVLKPVIQGHASSVEPKKEVEVAYVNKIQAALKNTVFEDGCSSWYKDKKTGWNGSAYPWSQAHFYFSNAFVKRSDWITTYTHKPRSTTLLYFVLVLLMIPGLMSFFGMGPVAAWLRGR